MRTEVADVSKKYNAVFDFQVDTAKSLTERIRRLETTDYKTQIEYLKGALKKQEETYEERLKRIEKKLEDVEKLKRSAPPASN